MSDPGNQRPVFLECAEVAEMLRLSERTLENWRLQDSGPCYLRLGTGGRAKVLYEFSTLLAWLKRHERVGSNKRSRRANGFTRKPRVARTRLTLQVL